MVARRLLALVASSRRQSRSLFKPLFGTYPPLPARRDEPSDELEDTSARVPDPAGLTTPPSEQYGMARPVLLGSR